MVSKKEPNQEKGWKAHLLAVAVIAASVLFILTSAAPAVQTPMVQPSTASNGYQPAPTMNSNITWSTFDNGWSPLEYNNGTANVTLNAIPSVLYPNYISVNPSGIIGKGTIQNEKVGGVLWNNTKNWATDAATQPDGTTIAYTNSTTDGATSITMTANTSASGTIIVALSLAIPISTLPSNNPAYDYVTGIIGETGKVITGQTASFEMFNGTDYAYPISIQAGQTAYFSESLKQISSSQATQFNISGKGAITSLRIGADMRLPQIASTTYTLTIYGLAVSEEPYSIGSQLTNGTSHTITNGTSTSIPLNAFNPDFAWQSIVNDSYTASISQEMDNTSIQQTSINDGTYTEQVTYQGTFSLPTAPDLSYSVSNVSVPLAIPGTQYEVANLNGVSYLSQIEARSNGTFTFAVVNPNSQNSLVLEVKYTTAQWDASSSPPSFFSLAGLEYYWWATLIAIMSFVGLGSAALSHFGADEEGLRIPKGKFGR